MSFRKKFYVQLIGLIVLLSILLSLTIPAYAEETLNINTISVECSGKAFELDVFNTGRGWYVALDDLAALADVSASTKKANKQIFIYKEEPMTILYSADADTYVVNNGRYYVPLQEAATASGIKFEVYNGELHAQIMRTPKELISEIRDNVFLDNRFDLSSIYISLGDEWTIAEVSARLYEMFSSFSPTEHAKALTGIEDLERYGQAMATIIKNDESDSSLFEDLGDINKCLTKTDKILDVVDTVYKKGGYFYHWLSGENEMLAEFHAYGDLLALYGNFANAREALNGYAEAADAGNFKDALDTFAYVETVIEAEESVIQAMQAVFINGDNRLTREAAEKVVRNRYNAIATVGGSTVDYVAEYFADNVDKIFEEDVFSKLNWKEKVAKFFVTQVTDYGFKLPDKSEAIIFLPIYGAIQQELALYYYDHNTDFGSENMSNMRAVSIMYLKAAIAAYENFEFDNGIDETIDNALETLRAELTVLLSYGECEYAPDYDNQEIIDWLNGQKEDLTPASSAPEMQSDSQISENGEDSNKNAYYEYSNFIYFGGYTFAYGYSHDVLCYSTQSHYYLLDMNGDGIDEIILYGKDLDYGKPYFGIFTYKNGLVQKLADSSSDFEFSQWDNASYSLWVADKNTLISDMHKSTVAYQDTYMYSFEMSGDEMKITQITDINTDSANPLILNGEIVGGIEIGSASDTLSKLYSSVDDRYKYIADSESGKPRIFDGEYFAVLADESRWSSNQTIITNIKNLNYNSVGYKYFNGSGYNVDNFAPFLVL